MFPWDDSKIILIYGFGSIQYINYLPNCSAFFCAAVIAFRLAWTPRPDSFIWSFIMDLLFDNIFGVAEFDNEGEDEDEDGWAIKTICKYLCLDH